MEMKTIVDVLEKLRIDDIVLSNKEFPIDGTLEEIVEFLEDYGFEDTDIYESGIIEVFDSIKSKCYTTHKNIQIWFADTSKGRVSKDNPIFFIKKKTNYDSGGFFVVYVDDKKGTRFLANNDKKGFLKELNKRFGWK